MSPKIIIEALPKDQYIPTYKGGLVYLNVAEFYFDTIQGEGIYTGYPAAFLRLQDCTLNCVYCDTSLVWKKGNPYATPDLLAKMNSTGLVDKLRAGQHLVLTGGSPLKQQQKLILLINEFIYQFGFKPFIEIENECILMPTPEMIALVDCWNNSPKLSDSGMPFKVRYNSLVLGTLGTLNNSWFKFVVTSEEDWEEISMDFIEPGFIEKDRIILMPEAATQAELFSLQDRIVSMAIRHNVRYSTRLHIALWDKKIGV
jgi:organic radical activating enzyme